MKEKILSFKTKYRYLALFFLNYLKCYFDESEIEISEINNLSIKIYIKHVYEEINKSEILILFPFLNKKLNKTKIHYEFKFNDWIIVETKQNLNFLKDFLDFIEHNYLEDVT